VGKPLEKQPFGKSGRQWKDNITIDPKDRSYKDWNGC
jgi:hypothetical protein